MMMGKPITEPQDSHVLESRGWGSQGRHWHVYTNHVLGVDFKIVWLSLNLKLIGYEVSNEVAFL